MFGRQAEAGLHGGLRAAEAALFHQRRRGCAVSTTSATRIEASRVLVAASAGPGRSGHAAAACASQRGGGGAELGGGGGGLAARGPRVRRQNRAPRGRGGGGGAGRAWQSALSARRETPSASSSVFSGSAPRLAAISSVPSTSNCHAHAPQGS